MRGRAAPPYSGIYRVPPPPTLGGGRHFFPTTHGKSIFLPLVTNIDCL